ncbi:MAG: hypothetical protein COU69_01660 [Candidatus Pacebacteria bacterium CG10_big_fil_rev_8_21_14_0_10_56_10]|nr:MAG: hypothetical protein COU69_01660 [Candidatus Pacebacteria bacterium CG10_big_fil_rev_8_21_14_0_10_56_10]
MSTLPSVSVIIVNYNGQHLLPGCLDSLRKVRYPGSKLEVVVVDNDSHDDSVSFIRQHYPEVVLIPSESNLGFAGGNNLGLEHAGGECVALLNSDTQVDPEWLRQLVAASQPDQVGVVTSKLYYHLPYLELVISSQTIHKADLDYSDDFRPIGVLMEPVNCPTAELSEQVWYLSGFYAPRQGNLTTRWTNGQARVLVPFEQTSRGKNVYQLTFHGYPLGHPLENRVKVWLGDQLLIDDTLTSNEVKQYRLVIGKRQAKSHLQWLVQNAGNIAFKNGYGRDRGSVVYREAEHALEFYDFDTEYYQRPRSLVAMCGASCLIKRRVIDEVGFFDESYFMYYEDMDLSFRIWKQGWDIVYCPSSVVYHAHRATTSQRNVKFFIELVERNHLQFTINHYPLKIVMIQLVLFTTKLCYSWLAARVMRAVGYFGRYFELHSNKAEARTAAATFLLGRAPELLRQRQRLLANQTRGFEEMVGMLY